MWSGGRTKSRPRRHPRLEQFIRASRAEDLGLARMLLDDEVENAAIMADAIRGLPTQSRPQAAAIPKLLGGVDTIRRLVDAIVAEGRPGRGQNAGDGEASLEARLQVQRFARP